MWLTLLGACVIGLPMLLVFNWRDKSLGFVSVFTALVVLHLIGALIGQALGVFSYSIFLTIWLFIGIATLFFVRYRDIKLSFSRRQFLCVVALLIILFELTSLHYRYDGPVDGLYGLEMAEKIAYPYPQYSDEWVAVSLIDYSIKNQSLPLANPLDHNKPFFNFMAGFHALMADIVLLLNLNPLTQYVWLAVAAGLITCLFVYLIVRVLGVHPFVSAVAMMTVPFIANTGMLPGIWYLLPYNASFLMLLAAVYGALKANSWITSASLLAMLIIYPPMIVFVIPLLLAILIARRKGAIAFKAFFIYLGISLLAAGSVIALGLNTFSLEAWIERAVIYFVRENGEQGIVAYAIWNIIPVLALPIALYGLIRLFRVRYYSVLLPTLAGLAYWSVYAGLDKVIIIEYPRIVTVTSILLMIAFGYGLDKAGGKVLDFVPLHKRRQSLQVIVFGTYFAFALLALGYPYDRSWYKLTLNRQSVHGEEKVTPPLPLKRHLKDDDLRLFAEIKEKRFLSPPWKGLVIGVATHNYPLHSKSSTITNQTLEYDTFLQASCKKKSQLAEKYKIDYVYSKKFNCLGFIEIGTSPEKLHLYEVLNN